MQKSKEPKDKEQYAGHHEIDHCKDEALQIQIVLECLDGRLAQPHVEHEAIVDAGQKVDEMESNAG